MNGTLLNGGAPSLEIPGGRQPAVLQGAAPNCPTSDDQNRQQFTCKLTIKVTVRTRLGDFIASGARVGFFETAPTAEGTGGVLVVQGEVEKVYPEVSGPPVPETVGPPSPECCTKEHWPNALVIEATYENPDENMKKEVARLFIEDLHTTPVAVKSTNVIRLIQDENDTARDRDYYELVVHNATKPSVQGITLTATDEEVAATASGHPTTGFAYAEGTAVSRITQTITGQPLCPEDPNARDITLHVTMYMATFSLDVPYVSQNNSSESLCVVPGRTHPHNTTTAQYIYEYSTNIHGASATNRTDLSGSILCAATCLEMLYQYYDMDVTQEDIRHSLQKDEYANSTTEEWRLLYNQNLSQAGNAVESAQRQVHRLRNERASATEIARAARLLTDAETRLFALRYIDSLPEASSLRVRIMILFSNVFPTTQASRLSMLASFPRAWQDWAAWAEATTKLLAWQGKNYNATRNFSIVFDPETGRSAGLDDVLVLGKPIISSILGGHIILVRGAVVNRTRETVRAICNDPYGTLSGSQSSNHWYSSAEGEINTKNDAAAALGKHVYYRGKGVDLETRTRSGGSNSPMEAFNFRAGGIAAINKVLTASQIQQKLMHGS